MKRSCMSVLVPMFFLAAALAFTGCGGVSSGDTALDTAGLNAGRSASTAAAESVAVTVSGLVVIVDGKTAVAYQGIPYYVSVADLVEGASVTVSGDASPILEWDAAGDFRFYGYSVKAGKVTADI